MPIYTYRCEGCGETFDKRQSFSDAPLTSHEACGGALKKVLHPAGIVFKGSGFYNTDYKNGSASAPKADEAAKSDGATSDAAKSEGGSTAASSDSSASGGASPSPASPSSTPAASSAAS